MSGTREAVILSANAVIPCTKAVILTLTLSEAKGKDPCISAKTPGWPMHEDSLTVRMSEDRSRQGCPA